MVKRIVLSLFIFLTPIALSSSAFAAQVDPFSDVCKKEPNASACKEKQNTVGNTSSRGDDSNPLFGPEGIMTKIINILSLVVGIVAVIGIMAAGLRFITSGSNPQQVTVAREMVLYAVVGLLVAALAQILVRFVLGKVTLLP